MRSLLFNIRANTLAISAFGESEKCGQDFKNTSAASNSKFPPLEANLEDPTHSQDERTLEDPTHSQDDDC